MKLLDTKQLILEKGAEIVHKKGFNHTGIQEILTAVGVPKGSFYFYFKSKEDFGLCLIDYYYDFLFGLLYQNLNDETIPPLQRLRNFFKSLFQIYEQNEFIGGCPVGKFAQEMSDLSEKFRQKFDDIFNQLKGKLVHVLVEAQNNKELSESLDIYATVDFIINSWQGSILRAKITKNSSALAIFDHFIFEFLLGK